MSFPDHFSAVADRYAAYRPRYPAALIDALVAHAPRGLVWEAGCGSGQLTLALAAHFDRVIATDPAAAQLAAAPAHPRVEYREVQAEDSGLPAGSAALVIAAQAAHWFDWARFVAEAGRVAQPGALVALVAYGRGELPGDAGAVLAHYYDVVTAAYWTPHRRLIEDGYRSLVMPWPAVEAPTIEMDASWTRAQLLGYVGTWSATSRLIADQGPGPFEALGAQLQRAWSDDEPRTIRWPLTARLARR